MVKVESFLRSIRRHYPDVPLSPVKEIGSGQNNVILQVGSDIIFRFPRYAAGIEQLKLEVQLLSIISKYVSLKVPYPTYRVLDKNKETHAFVGYIRIEGEPLDADGLNQIENYADKQRIADQLSDFLMELHQIDLGHFSNCLAVNKYDPFQEWRDLYDHIKKKLYPFMTEEACRRTDRHFTDFFACEKSAAIIPSIIHGDFGTSNILYDKSSHRITGIIDFGSAHVGDPAIDYAALLASYGVDFFQLIEKRLPEVKSMIERVLFYKGTFALQEALFGLEHDDPIAFTNGITAINTFD